MGKQPPAGFFYEMFLDEEGRKISKSVGKGLTIDTWVNYAPLESLLYYLFQNPKQAKRLYWGIVPKSVDDYLMGLRRFPEVAEQKRPDSALWHMFEKGASVPEYNTSINFSLINNLISAVGKDDVDLMLEYLKRYDASAEAYSDVIADLVHKGMNYYRDFILPNKHFRTPTDEERQMLQSIHDQLLAYEGDDEQELQSIPFEVARQHDIPPRDLFTMFYEVVLGQGRGPRFGTFVKLVGKDHVLSLLEKVKGEDE
jgi:lysyl-tRNA synthetase class 1